MSAQVLHNSDANDAYGVEFFGWLKAVRKRWLLALPTLGVGFSLALKTVERLSSLDDGILEVLLFAGQLVACIAALCLIPDPLGDVKLAPRAAHSLEQFLRAWKALWFSWILLYALLSARACLAYYGIAKGATYWGLFENMLNNSQTVCSYMCYSVLAKSTVDSSRADSPLPWLKYFSFLLLALLVEVIACIVTHNAPAGTSPHGWVSGIQSWARLVSGLGSGIVLALVFGRFDSKFIDPPTWMMPCLYFYAILQAAWEKVPLPGVQAQLIVGLALSLKLLLFVFVYWLLRSGVLFFYFEEVGKLLTSVSRDRSKYLSELRKAKTSSANRPDRDDA